MLCRRLLAIASLLLSGTAQSSRPDRPAPRQADHIESQDPRPKRSFLRHHGLDRGEKTLLAKARLGAVALGVILSAGCAQAESRPIVVVELFTSQGCSSCPPAEALLLDLAQKPDVLALAFHVDYWDRLGWPDPYASPEATRRQYDYAGNFGASSVYTPQIVVGGRVEMVGSYRAEVLAAVEAALANPEASVDLDVDQEGGSLSINIGAGQGRGRLLLVGFDPRIVTAVRRGENAGRSIEQANVVRSVATIATWDGSRLDMTHPVPMGEKTALILQAPEGQILGAVLVVD